MRSLSEVEMREVKGGEAITLSAVLALMSIALVSVIAYKLFFSEGGGKVTLPGGFSFSGE